MRAISILILLQLRGMIRILIKDPRRYIPAAIFVILVVHAIVSSSFTFPIPAYNGDNAGALNAAHAIVEFVFGLLAIASVGIGFSASCIAFSPPDLDYLLVSPIPRRATLAFHAWRSNVVAAQMAAFIVVVYRLFSRPLVGPGEHGGSFWCVFVASFLFCAALNQFSVAIAAIFGKRSLISNAVQFSLLIVFVAMLIVCASMGFGACVDAMNSAPVATIFFACRWISDILIACVRNQPFGIPMMSLAGFYIVSTVLVFARPYNFYETAFFATLGREQVRASVKASKGLHGGMHEFADRYNRRAARRDYTIPAFGTGASAVLWANFASAAKRPWINFIGPMLVGAMFGSLAAWQPVGAGQIVPFFTLFFIMFSIMGSVFALMPVLQRQPLVGPLPIPPWKRALPEILPLTVISCLPIWTMAAALAIGRVPDIGQEPLILATCIPILILSMNAIAFAVLVGLANVKHDVLGQFIGKFALYAGYAVLVAMDIAIMLATRAPGVPAWCAVMLAIPGLALVAGLTICLAGRIYADMSAADDSLSPIAFLRALPGMPRRTPNVEEALWLTVLSICATQYCGLWLSRHGMVPLTAVAQAMVLAFVVLFAWLGRYHARVVFALRAGSAGGVVGAVLIVAGAIPWLGALDSLQHALWRSSMQAADALLPFIASGFLSHPVLAPIATGAIIGICEELLFRGAIQTALVNRLGPLRGIILTAFLFALSQTDYRGFLARLSLGLLLGWLVWRGKSIYPAILSRALIEIAGFGFLSWVARGKAAIAMSFAAAHMRHLPTPNSLTLACAYALILAGAAVAIAAGAWIAIPASQRRIFGPLKDSALQRPAV
jgi:membrane protease YdiL (CAAX protease family)